jgi:hypothetical protein
MAQVEALKVDGAKAGSWWRCHGGPFKVDGAKAGSWWRCHGGGLVAKQRPEGHGAGLETGVAEMRRRPWRQQ